MRLLDNGSVVAMHDFTLNETPLKYDYSCDFDLQYYSTGSTMELSAFMKGYANDYIINWNNDLIGQEQLYTYPNDLTSNWESIFVHVNSAQLSCAQSQSGAIRLNPSTGYGEAAFLSNGNMLVVTDYMQAEIFNAVYIEYTDESGLSYNSASIPQDLVFSILNVETFDIDENGNSTVKIDFSVDHVQLLSVSGESIDLTNFTGSIALAHPGT